MTSEQLHEQLAAADSGVPIPDAMFLRALRDNLRRAEGKTLTIINLEDTINEISRIADRLALADETPPASGVAGDGPISAAASNDRIAELEQALRESTELMQTVLASNATTGWRYLRGRIAANERLLGGNKNG